MWICNKYIYFLSLNFIKLHFVYTFSINLFSIEIYILLLSCQIFDIQTVIPTLKINQLRFGVYIVIRWVHLQIEGDLNESSYVSRS